jgi:hypothetical protein
MDRYRNHLLAGASISVGLLVGVPARAASLQKINQSDWWGGVSGLPSYVNMYIYVPDQRATLPPIVVAPHHCQGNGPGTYDEIALSLLGEVLRLMSRRSAGVSALPFAVRRRRCASVRGMRLLPLAARSTEQTSTPRAKLVRGARQHKYGTAFEGSGAFGLRVLSANLPRPAGAQLMRLVAEERDQEALDVPDALASR